MAAAAILKHCKIAISLQWNDRSSGHHKPQNLVILKIKDGGGSHLENRKIAISLLCIDQF